jgi:peptidoglycan/xylan/chitin deacetylase (PgdA/CDA1 family)
MTGVANEAASMNGRSSAHIDVLMYHSISTGPGPTCIAPEIFAAQMAALAEAGYQIKSLSELAERKSGIGEPDGKIAVITFDDAYVDFAANAAPLLLERGWTATVFAPTGWVGRRSGWVGAGGEALMDWKDIRSLFEAGVEFGSHSVSHSDLTTLSSDNLRSELTDSQSRLEQELGAPVRTFAAPYGAANAGVRTEIARFYDVAVGTRLARAERKEDIHDVPRIEMHYFRDIDRWRQYLAGKAEVYFALRQFARSVRSAISY